MMDRKNVNRGIDFSGLLIANMVRVLTFDDDNA